MKISIMINEEDHLRIQSITNGMNINEAFVANKVDDINESLIMHFMISMDLTSCPTNLGTGISILYVISSSPNTY